MTVTQTSSPFHRGERDIQTRLGVRDKIENVGQRFIRDYMPDEHRAFFAELPLVFVGSVDASGRPWASVLVGRPGFTHAPEARRLHIGARLIHGDPLVENLSRGVQLGLLGIQYSTRRRNRLTGKVKDFADGHIEVGIDQTFGNCPQYIQTREFEVLPELDAVGEPRSVSSLERLDERARAIIAKSDNFYIATHYSEIAEDDSHGADVSHRGGKPGFVRIEDDRTFTYPDFVGNYHFNTLGNIALNPRAGLLFIDFDSGDLLYLTCRAEVVWDSDEKRAFTGAQRLVRLTLEQGSLIEDAMPLRWRFGEYSPILDKTGSWEEVAEKLAAREAGNVYRRYRVARVQKESDNISSFFLEPEDDERLPCHKAGQFLPIEVEPPGAPGPVPRTYTISNAPNGDYFRLSIKREPSASPDVAPGVSSNFFHDHVKLGTTIRAMSPRGRFSLDPASTRPVVLISGGVGITPMVSMLEQLVNDTKSCGAVRNVWFVHGATEGSVHAFGEHVRALAQSRPEVRAHIRYSRPSTDDVEGKDYDSVGRVDVDLLRSLLPFDDYEFYLCGPVGFMETLYSDLKALNIADERIHYEFFGKGSSLLKPQPSGPNAGVDQTSPRAPVTVEFARSGVEARWEPSRGTLLDLAESEGLRPAYSCRSGICQTCATKVIGGDVEYDEPPMADVDDGVALICSSFPRANGGDGEQTSRVVLDL